MRLRNWQAIGVCKLALAVAWELDVSAGGCDGEFWVLNFGPSGPLGFGSFGFLCLDKRAWTLDKNK